MTRGIIKPYLIINWQPFELHNAIKVHIIIEVMLHF